ncbi:multidrug ABC transporter ATP-binding protein [Paenibacillus pectinilyticus]|uniref:Multidrug ABC transporter ATP-binding protein n=1 Tax=Paenibacillus pectinilyticus TaxID=512399 RepID=A0A1C0ZYH3_9BACL|nr:ATP-binding cassette domain-containing protein [Paenibacillus pectinilyticus]OCT13193.1 multidrug ABC transporter ATP-binding protein [Paenibacillus pectinilyticus]
MLEVKQVSKLYENSRGVHNIDFSMQRGEIVGFLGPNGAGKTTTMRMITGYLNPTHGQIWVDGHSMADNPKKARRKIGYLPETPPLYPEMTVQSYLRFIANLRDVPAREQKLAVAEAISKLGLQGREKQIIRSLSKGYKQRVGLAQAILHKPDLLVLDEPTSGLDPKQIIEIRQLIHELGENHTVLLSTHILPEINAICNRVLIINQGRVVLDERPEHLGRTMGETFEVSLEVKGPRERILTELRSLSSVGEVKEVDAPAAGIATLDAPALQAASELNSADEAAEIPAVAPVDAPIESVKLLVTSADRAEDIREALFFHLANAKLPILEMKRESLSLEDIFLKLTTDEPADTSSTSQEEVDTDA